MRKFLSTIVLLGWVTQSSAQRIHVVTTYPYIADLVEKIGMEKVRVHGLAQGDWNPHTVVSKPSFIAHLRKADLLVINGAQLEIGWLPPLIAQANNPKIQTGTSGILDLSKAITLIDVPASVSRAQGDVHPDGNPHFYLDPFNIPALAEAIAGRLSELDPPSASSFQSNLQAFLASWNDKLVEWKEKMKPFDGAEVIEYHKNFDYFLRRFNLRLAGTIEPLPGIPPTSKHTESLERMISNKTIRFIFQDVYNPDAAARHLSKKYGIPVVVFPHDVGSVKGAEGIYSLYDEMLRRLNHE